MAALATLNDIESRWRSLSDDEVTNAAALLEDASAIVRQQVSGIDTRLADSDYLTTYPGYPDTVVAVVSRMVLRVLRNPEGKRSEQIDDYSYTRDNSVSGGGLYLAADEAALLRGSPTAAAFSIRAVADPGYALPSDAWSETA